MSPSHKGKIVIVEDEGLIAADLASRLEAAGYSVPGTADTARQALELIEQTSPDAVLMDIRLKGAEDGIQAASLIREKLDVPVVFLTAYEDRGTLERAGQTQAYGYIKKPIASASLRGTLEIAISKHRYERHLREERDWALASFGSVPYAVLVTDGSGRVTYLNAQAEELAGWSVDRALGQPAGDVLRLQPSSTCMPIQDLIRIAMIQAEKVALPKGACLKGSAEQIFEIEGNIAPRWNDGRMDGTVIALTDVTLRRFEEEQLRQESTQDALVRMADGVVRHMSGLSTIAEESTHLVDSLPEDSPLRPHAEKIENSAMDAFATTTHLQAFVEPPELQLERVLLNDVAARFQEAFRVLDPSFTVVNNPDPMPVQADPWQLVRGVLNILLHARGRMQSGTGLVMDVSGAEPEQIGHWVRLGVTYATTDEDSESLQRIFEPSWSGASEDLHITYSLVKRMGGLMSARMAGPQTVRIEIYLPRVASAAAGAPLPNQDQAALLLIEPNPEIARILHVHFESHGYNLLEARSCEEARMLADLYDGPIRLVLANPAQDDPCAVALAEDFAAIDPAIQLLAVNNYTGSCASGSPGVHHLTKWDLLARVKQALDLAQLVESGA